MAYRLKITVALLDDVDPANAGSSSITLQGLTALHSVLEGAADGTYRDAPAGDVASRIAKRLAVRLAGGAVQNGEATLSPNSAIWRRAMEILGTSDADAVKRGSDAVAADIAALTLPHWREKLSDRPTSNYNGGGRIDTVTGSATVTGIGTAFLTADSPVIPGKHALSLDGKQWLIADVPSDTTLTLDTVYDGPDEVLSPRRYTIVPYTG